MRVIAMQLLNTPNLIRTKFVAYNALNSQKILYQQLSLSRRESKTSVVCFVVPSIQNTYRSQIGETTNLFDRQDAN